MTKLALEGGPASVIGLLRPFNTIGHRERMLVSEVLNEGKLSGYLGGIRRGGYWVQRLETEWCEFFGVRHAVAVNSATSGLLIACMAAGVKTGTRVWTTPYTMSATAAAPKFLGADIIFDDIDEKTFGLDRVILPADAPVAIITHLFGGAARTRDLVWSSVPTRTMVIEDNAQAFLATEYGTPTGTIGHIGVWSLNVHKSLQAGEGGVCTTDDDNLATQMRDAMNHGEMSGGPVGLNLRMTEVTAAMACAQLSRAKEIVSERVEVAEAVLDSMGDIPSIKKPFVRANCRHVYYCIGLQVDSLKRDWFAQALQAEGVPIRAGYLKPLYTLPAFKNVLRPDTAVVEQVESQMLLYENCAYSPTKEQIKQIGEAFKKVAEDRRNNFVST